MKLQYLATIFLGMTLLLSSCVKDEIYNGPATITSVAFTPSTVTPDDVVTVSANVTSVKGVETVSLFYKANAGSYVTVPMTASPGNNYTGSIPKQADQTTIVFYVGAKTKAVLKTVRLKKHTK